jgi:hypothetical protein
MMGSSAKLIGATSGALLVSMVVACGGRDGNAPQTPAAAPPEHGAVSSSPYGVFAADADSLVEVSVAALVGSELWESYGELVLRTLDADSALAQLRETCGFDPIADIESITLGGHTAQGGESVAIVRGPSRAVIEGCLEVAVEELNGVREQGTLSRYVLGEEEFLLGWLDDRTAIVGLSEEVDPQALARRLAGEPGLAHDAEVVRLLEGRVDSDAAVRLALLPIPGSELARLVGQTGLEVSAIYGSIRASEVLDVALGLELGSEQQAQQTRDELAGVLPVLSGGHEGLGAILTKLELAARGAHLVATLSLTAEDLQAVAEVAGGGPFEGSEDL